MSWASLAKTSVGIGTVLVVTLHCAALGAGPAEKQSYLDSDFERFAADKRALVKRLSDKYHVVVPRTIDDFFDAAQKGDWQAASNLFSQLKAPAGDYGPSDSVPDRLWVPVHETFGAYEQFHLWNPPLLHRFGDHIIRSIPPGSIYLGGTDPGRFVVSAVCTSQTDGRPFFTVTQNALTDPMYLDYLREIYGAKLDVPSSDDAQIAFQQYVRDASVRKTKNQLKEGESVEFANNRVVVSGAVAVMAISEILARKLIDRNPSAEFYLEESYPFESLYRQSLPHGLIFKVDHQPLEKLPESVVEADHRFWTNECRQLIGSGIHEKTSVTELCAWSERIFLHPESTGFDGNLLYVKDTEAPSAFSYCRSALATYYQWWSRNGEKAQSARLDREADLAHRQAVALCPQHPVVAWRYTDYLLQKQRTNDAKALARTSVRLITETHVNIDSDRLKNAMNKLRSAAETPSSGPSERQGGER